MPRRNMGGIRPTPFVTMRGQQFVSVARSLWEDIREIVLFALFTAHLPESVLHIPFCHEYLHVLRVRGFCECMDDPAEAMT